MKKHFKKMFSVKSDDDELLSDFNKSAKKNSM